MKRKEPTFEINSIDQNRQEHNVSPFNATLSQIDAKNSESNGTSMLTPQNFCGKSIKVGKLSFAETQGDEQLSEQLSVMGSIE